MEQAFSWHISPRPCEYPGEAANSAEQHVRLRTLKTGAPKSSLRNSVRILSWRGPGTAARIGRN